LLDGEQFIFCLYGKVENCGTNIGSGGYFKPVSFALKYLHHAVSPHFSHSGFRALHT
jgi:hypothetical protein